MKKKPLRLREPEQERRLDRPLRLRDDEQTLKVRLKPFRDLCSLTSDEEIDLIYRARAGDARAKERVVAAHIGFLMRKAKRYARLKVLPIDDLFQEGCMGFQRAVERFNPDRGARLATYASKIVDGAMLDALDKKAVMRTVPHHIRRMLNRYREGNENQAAHRRGTGSTIAARHISISIGRSRFRRDYRGRSRTNRLHS